MSTDTETFTLIRTLPGGHRLFLSSRDSRIAIADRSGRTPDQTDDGVLYVTHGAVIQAGERGCTLPLTTPGGEATRTNLTPADAVIVAAMLAMPIQADGVLFTSEVMA